jgi:hypothetical protein
MHLVITVFTSGPNSLSSTARFPSVKRLLSEPKIIDWSCNSHSPPWSQIGQSSGWLISKNSITPSLAFFTKSVVVLMFMFGITGMAHEATGFGDFSTSTRHILQFPAMDKRGW